jgi:hypothetical protein
MFEFDGFLTCITGKSNGGKIVKGVSMMSLIVSAEWENYIKRLDSFLQKYLSNKKIQLDENYDGISAEKNKELYKLLVSKIENLPYNRVFSNQLQTLQGGEEKFINSSLQNQVEVLASIISILKVG